MGEDRRLTPQSEDFAAWYNEVVLQAELADYTPVRGCMVIRPYGFRIWELMQRALDDMFKATGHQNASFPLFLPKSALDREAAHVEGFAPQTALVTHGGGQELEEPLVVRPTSEAIIWPIVANWIQSYRDLPVLLNQWGNVVRWELRTRPFLRTTEFLWQEGHTAHATAEEARQETLRMLGVYREFMHDWMAMPVITGRKTESERFAGAEDTYALEALMKDNKALQAGTSHYLGQNFARAFGVTFQTEQGAHEFVYNTSWGVSTRMVGGLIMTHGDDDGLVLPPRLAPHQVVIVPIWKDDAQRATVAAACEGLRSELGEAVRVHIDARETLNPGAKYYEWERRGAPLRVEVGPRDVERGEVIVVHRFTPPAATRKQSVQRSEAAAVIPRLLTDIQVAMLAAATERREANTVRGVTDLESFRDRIADVGGFVFTGWCGSGRCEEWVKEETRASIRVIPDEQFRSESPPPTCIACGERAIEEVVWARAY